ncbi:TetR/AcrR family transcriptional regulator [Amycolatopsis anabasis]|uniref:TetR/AcrR family transcriptional regulator n=1 Tax=Amycolatopsis anabasis TaxID=1840409 RepID=UPI00131CE49C|nr:TetR/AcrR family transcriptional regulator [Amycolatopsis anabasis]
MSERKKGGRDGRALRWEGQRERRRAEFVAAAIEAIEEHGPDVLTEQIAARAGVPRPRLYRHFDDKLDLRHAVCRRIVDLLAAELSQVWAVERTPLDLISSAVETAVRWLTTHDKLYRYVSRQAAEDPAHPPAMTGFKDAFAANLNEVFGNFLRSADLPARDIAPFTAGLIAFSEAAINRWLRDPGEITADRFTADLTKWLWTLIDGTLREQGIRLDPDQPLALALDLGRVNS